MMQTLNSAGKPTAGSLTIPAPVGGINMRDSIADMDRTDALQLDNMIPRTNYTELRKGSEVFSTIPADIPGVTPHNIRSLLTYSSPAGAKKFFAAAEDGLYDVTSGGTVAAVSTALTGNLCQSVNISTAGGSFLWVCNGVDDSRYFNGLAWTVLNTLSTPSLTGVVSASIANVSLFKSRLIFCCKDSLSFWFLPVNSLAGVASEFPLGAVFRRGGYLLATESWTLDGGNGPDDYFVAVTSEGEVAIYKGTNPADASAWSLVGVYYVGKPLGRRCLLRFGADMYLMTVGGLLPMSKVMQSAVIDRREAISNKIVGAWTQYTASFSALFGWQPVVFPSSNLLLVNIPIFYDAAGNYTYSYQLVMDTTTKAWCRFTGLHAEVWAEFDGSLYFARHNKVYKALTSSDDCGFPIDARVRTAFFYPGGRGNIFQVTLFRLICTVSAKLNLNLGIASNYEEDIPNTSAISYGGGSAVWDVSMWDTAFWSSGETSSLNWKSVNHTPGRAISVLLRVLSKGVTMKWNATELIGKTGGML